MYTIMTPYLEAAIAETRADLADKGFALNMVPITTELESAIAETRINLAHRPDLAECLVALIVLGLVEDSGERRHGHRVWKAVGILDGEL